MGGEAVNAVSAALLKYLRENAEVYRTSRSLYISPAQRAIKVKFYEDSAEEVERLADLWDRVNPVVMNGGR
jgi:hypothetical protein